MKVSESRDGGGWQAVPRSMLKEVCTSINTGISVTDVSGGCIKKKKKEATVRLQVIKLPKVI